MPAWSTICDWKVRIPDFAAMYARARESSAELLEARALRRAAAATAEDVQAARLEVDALKWAAAKRFPKVYAERAALQVEGDISLTVMTREEHLERILAHQAKLGLGGPPMTIEGTADSG